MTRERRPGRGWRPLRLTAAVLAAVALLLATAAPGHAHAQLLESDPTDGTLLEEAPREVTLTFNEPVRLTAQEITVYDAAGQPIPSQATASGPEVTVTLPEPDDLRGTYVVGWFVLSADGHPISGALTFSVGERSSSVTDPPPPPTSSAVVTTTQGLVGGAMYVGLLLATGLAAFVLLVLPASYAGRRVRARVRWVVRVGAAVAVVAALLAVPVSSVYAQGAELPAVLSGFDATLVLDELISAALIAVGLGVVVLTLGEDPPGGGRRAALAAGAGLALVGPAVVGHTRSYAPTSLLVAADVVHVVAGAVWLGGLVGLALTLRAVLGREQLAASTLARFSVLAGGALLAVAVAGTVLGWRVVGSWSALVETGYGRLLLVKVGVALIVAGLGGWNRYRLLPRVRGAVGFADRGGAVGLVTRTVRVEAALLVVLLAMTGFLVNQSPRPAPVEVPPGRTGVQAGALTDLQLYATLTPLETGANTLLVQLQDETGEPVVPPEVPEVQLRSGGLDLGSVPLAETDTGTYRAEVLLPRPGVWEVQVALRISRFESPVTTVRFTVPES
ncbi:copper resistance protein CopC [Nocardioides coralli]|uniref:copper resistance CopC/CopD family protein n=1 Tax=Nocardioides coralli TaxID=2872154 RepID=UPI001CA40176|nr:copper resistance protein CopC [Nocardioides coralli]QZY28548.1 copper resistance protein CopC/CopD [Nocardioides coralli]